jgi:hypothetical protein
MVLTLGLFGCGAPPSGQDETLGEVTQTLVLGDRGPEVRRLNTWFQNFGYMPNAELQKDYPAWRPIVDRRPADMDAFDETTLNALRHFQSKVNLEASGVFDAETRQKMYTARCGVPDGIEQIDPDAKFDLTTAHFTKWRWEFADKTIMPWIGGNCGSNADCDGLDTQICGGQDCYDCVNSRCQIPTGRTISDGDARDAVRSALTTWTNTTNVSFTEVTSGGADDGVMVVHWSDCSTGCGNLLAATNFTKGIRFDPTKPWTTTGTNNNYDFQTVALHEIGHGIGLNHSSLVPHPTMWPSPPGTGLAGQDRSVHLEDKFAADSLYKVWTTMPGAARDIAAGGTVGNEVVWIVGNTARTGGYNLFKWDGSSTWVMATGPEGAIHIAVGPDRIPWIVSDNGTIYKRSGTLASSGSWSVIAGCAKDIGIGGDSSVWIVGCTAVTGGFGLYKWNGSNDWTASNNGSGVRISVGPTGVPWVVNSSGTLNRRTTSSPLSGSWDSLGGGAKDVGVGFHGFAWKVSDTPATGGFSLYLRDEQPAGNTGVPVASAVAKWVPFPGGGTDIASGATGPWVVKSNHDIAQ